MADSSMDMTPVVISYQRLASPELAAELDEAKGMVTTLQSVLARVVQERDAARAEADARGQALDGYAARLRRMADAVWYYGAHLSSSRMHELAAEMANTDRPKEQDAATGEEADAT